MPHYRCNSCQGEYDDPTPDGYRYFHMCPQFRVNPAGQRVPIPNRRDENIVEERADDGSVLMESDPEKREHWRSKRHIRSEGLGREEVT